MLGEKGSGGTRGRTRYNLLYYPGNTPGGQDSQGYIHGSLKQNKNQPTNQPASQPTNQPASQPTNQPTNQPANQPTEKQTLEDGGGWFTRDTREDGYSSASGSSGWEGPREETGQELLKCPTSGRRRLEHLPVPHSRILLSFPRKTACETSLNGRAATARPGPQSWILDPRSSILNPRSSILDPRPSAPAPGRQLVQGACLGRGPASRMRAVPANQGRSRPGEAVSLLSIPWPSEEHRGGRGVEVAVRMEGWREGQRGRGWGGA